MHIIDAKIISNQEVAKHIYLLSIEASDIASTAKPGQFVMLKLNPYLSYILRRPFSICLTNQQGHIYILYKIKGKGTQYISKMRKGDKISVIGPLGNGFPILKNYNQIFLLGGGIGVAPLISLLPYYGNKSIFIAGYKSKSTYINIAEIFRTKYKYIVATEDGSIGYKGTLVDLFKKYLDEYLKNTQNKIKTIIVSCGPIYMLKKIYKIAYSIKIPLYVSMETYMACGLGLCQGCVIKGKTGYMRVCKEGPVFKAEYICWKEL